jgi:hypothetical protein
MKELNGRNPLVVSISQTSKKVRLYELIQNLTITNPGIKEASSKASRG